ncbi:hypothetical protein BU23DRAFT_175203 [Bimuria novae-zelandiae CBS 107.79]|uniref:Uncharacterized protein n=1 Tax=Bimuria novae-zelandiae CBS 107.79 TaxID=1447943 RepID=A0A6A5V4V1_9PLEO|nr:hypothetical protein BU23DRAFT_175203 [Bimuria novae-zelandiae CBS 107.79]
MNGYANNNSFTDYASLIGLEAELPANWSSPAVPNQVGLGQDGSHQGDTGYDGLAQDMSSYNTMSVDHLDPSLMGLAPSNALHPDPLDFNFDQENIDFTNAFQNMGHPFEKTQASFSAGPVSAPIVQPDFTHELLEGISHKRARTSEPIPAAPSKRIRTATPTCESPPARSTYELLETKWSEMTPEEKARILLPIINGRHPCEFDADVETHGAMRQREALQRAHDRVATTVKSTPGPASAVDMEAVKAREEKLKRQKEKRAAAMRAKRAAEKEKKRVDMAATVGIAPPSYVPVQHPGLLPAQACEV